MRARNRSFIAFLCLRAFFLATLSCIVTFLEFCFLGVLFFLLVVWYDTAVVMYDIDRTDEELIFMGRNKINSNTDHSTCPVIPFNAKNK